MFENISIRSVTRLIADRRGGTAVAIALAAPMLVGMTGIGVETGLWYSQKRQLQSAADAAASSAALDRVSGGRDSMSTLTSAALRAAGKNGFTGAAPDTFALNWPPTSGPMAGNTAAVEAVLTHQQRPLLSALFLREPVTISARSVATVKTSGQACILALDPTASGAVTNGGNASQNFAGCVVAANSTSPSAISFSGSVDMTAQSLWTAGGYTSQGSAAVTLTQPATTYAWALPDPYADYLIPGIGTGCLKTNAKYNNVTATISPGVYCGGIDFGAKADITMAPGTYYINKGDLTINAQANITGDGVTIVLTSSGPASQIGTVTINGGATVNLTAPGETTADFPGLVFFQDRRADPSATNKLNGGSSMNIAGGIYFPAETVQFSGNNGTEGPSCTIIVARLVTFTGNSSIVDNNCAAAGVPPIQVAGVKFVN